MFLLLDRITIKLFGLFAINNILWILFLTLTSFQITSQDLFFINCWIVICYLCMLGLTKLVSGSFSFLSAWLLVTIPFYFGQILFHDYYESINYLKNIRSIFNGLFSGQTIISNVFFTLDCLILICVAFSYNYQNNVRKVGNINKELHTNENDIDNMRIVSSAIFLITILPTIYFWIYAQRISSAYGYVEMKAITSNVSKTSIVFISSYLSGWFLPAAYMSLISSKSKIWRGIVILSLAVTALLIFRAGSRYKAIEIFVAYVLIDIYWLNRGQKTNIKKYVVIFAVILLCSVLVRSNRVGNDFSGSSDDFIDSILGDSGSTIMINCAALQFIPEKLGFGYGISFLNGVVAILPNFLRDIISPNHQMDITGVNLTQLCGVTWSNFGSSIIAEGYFNFGYFSLLLMILYGLIMGKIVYVQKSIIGQLSPCKFILFVYLCAELIFSIRSEITSTIRGIVLFVLLPIALIKLMGVLKADKRK